LSLVIAGAACVNKPLVSFEIVVRGL